MPTCKRLVCLLGLVGLLAILSGCFVQSTEELYALPRQSDVYYDLQNAIDAALPADAAFSGPLTGSNQQAVQLADLDGDGEDEALVFAKTSGAKPLKVYIFDDVSGSFSLATVIEGDGTAFDAVEYVSVDGNPGLEVILGRQLSDQILQSLSVYAYGEGRMAELMNTSYTEFKVVDLNSDDRQDVLVLRQDPEGRTAVAEYYTDQNGLMEKTATASLAKEIDSIERITTGYVTTDVPGVFVTSSSGEDTLVTDVLLFRGQTFLNLTISPESGLSTQMVRSYLVYATDIDEDGLVELPTLVALPSVSNEGTYWLVEWYELHTDGTHTKKMTTFYHNAGGWYLTIPEAWAQQLTVARTAEENGVWRYTFSRWIERDTTPEEIMSIYVISGEDRLKLAESQGRFLLTEKGETAYAASLGESTLAGSLTEETVRAMFHFIRTDWNSGDIM